MFATCYVSTYIELLYSLVVHLRKVTPVHYAFAVLFSHVAEPAALSIELSGA